MNIYKLIFRAFVSMALLYTIRVAPDEDVLEIFFIILLFVISWELEAIKRAIESISVFQND